MSQPGTAAGCIVDYRCPLTIDVVRIGDGRVVDDGLGDEWGGVTDLISPGCAFPMLRFDERESSFLVSALHVGDPGSPADVHARRIRRRRPYPQRRTRGQHRHAAHRIRAGASALGAGRALGDRHAAENSTPVRKVS